MSREPALQAIGMQGQAFGTDYNAVLFDLEAVLADGVRAYPGAAAFLRRLHTAGIPVGLASSVPDARGALAAAGLHSLVDVVVDPHCASALGSQGGADPSILLELAHRLGVPASETVVIDASEAGVAAARAGGFGLVVGIDRLGRRDRLEAAAADVVVDDVGELDLGASKTDPWVLVYRGFDPAHEGHREALTAVGNGYMATRGALPEHSDDGIHYPGTYLAGVYNRLVSRIHGLRLEEEHMVNIPNWLPVDLRIGEGPWWSSGTLAVSDERRELHLRPGVMHRYATLTNPDGRRLAVEQSTFASMDEPHIAVQRMSFTPLGWSGTVTVRGGIDAGVRNADVAGSVGSTARHLAAAVLRDDGDIMSCEVQTKQSRIRIAIAMCLSFSGAAGPPGSHLRSGRQLTRVTEVDVVDGVTVTLTKVVSIFSSRDSAISSPLNAATELVRKAADDVPGLAEGHQAAWRRLWSRFAVTIDADPLTQLVTNLHIFHVLQAISPHSARVDAGVPARGLHGEGYRGHVFWDEVFVVPVVGLRLPSVARALLDYRWRRLGAARATARSNGLPGAQFPWQSGSDGREETPSHIYNPRSARWMPDNSRRQRHVGLAVAWNAWQYFQATGDLDWLTENGAELLIEVTRHFVALTTYDGERDRFHIAGVMGPDEYHDGYPDDPGSGLRDNMYTNVLVSWLCARAGDALDALAGHARDELMDRLGLSQTELAHWEHVVARLAVHIHSDGIISQFDGYEGLAELDWEKYRQLYGNIGRLDLILESEDDSTNRYKASKQPDVVMLVYLLGEEELLGQLSALGCRISREDLHRTVDYYLARTSDGSTLSRVVHASVLAGIDPGRSWRMFRQALIADLDDTQWGTTREGIHLGAMAGSVDIVVRSFAGLRLQSDGLVFSPRMPDGLRTARFELAYRGHRLNVVVSRATLTVTVLPSRAGAVRVRVGKAEVALEGGSVHEFAIRAQAR